MWNQQNSGDFVGARERGISQESQKLYVDKETGYLFSSITEENFILFAVKNYNNPQCSGIEEFHKDLDKIKIIKRQLSRYYMADEINERLFLNNMITFFNVFYVDAAKLMLIHKVRPEHWRSLKTAMKFLGYLYEHDMSEIQEDIELREKLENL